MSGKNMNRRKFIATSSAAGMAATLIPAWACGNSKHLMQSHPVEDIPYVQQPLAYSPDALEPAIDTATMQIHYGKHAAAYAKNLSEAVQAEGVDISKEKLSAVLSKISKYSTKMRNNAGGHYNHEFFWKSMKAPVENNMPDGNLLEAIKKYFGSFDAFKTQFADAGKNRFGSGWAWLVKAGDGKLVIGSTPNQDNPLMDISDLKGTPLLGLDVWEHAYYLKYQNKRADYINAWWSLVNWPMVQARM
jgi:superoxide dismutase, Fe-Mn family